MRVYRSLQFLAVSAALATIAACTSSGTANSDTTAAVVPAAAAPVAAAATPAPTTGWDSAPLDRAYHDERVAMDKRHEQEIAHPRADESIDKRAQRQTNENKELERRYAQGKTDHARNLPPSR